MLSCCTGTGQDDQHYYLITRLLTGIMWIHRLPPVLYVILPYLCPPSRQHICTVQEVVSPTHNLQECAPREKCRVPRRANQTKTQLILRTLLACPSRFVRHSSSAAAVIPPPVPAWLMLLLLLLHFEPTPHIRSAVCVVRMEPRMPAIRT